MFLYTYAVKLNALITKCVISERGLIWGEQFSGGGGGGHGGAPFLSYDFF